MNDLFQPVRDFETRMATFTGFEYAVAVESCSAALFLCCNYLGVRGEIIKIPSRTYPSAAAAVCHNGGGLCFEVDQGKWQWKGYYELNPLDLWDSAKYIGRGMATLFNKEAIVCLSFHAKKCLPIGRGGMILTNDRDVKEWAVRARHDGRTDKVPLKEDELKMVGWNMLMTPEQASRGIALMGNLKYENLCEFEQYPDLSRFDIWGE